MSSNSKTPKYIFFRNPDRDNKQALEIQVPEHERLNAHEDPPELRKIRYKERLDKIKQEFRNIGNVMNEQTKNISLGALSGFNEDKSWLSPEEIISEDITSEDLPPKPKTPFEQTYEEAPNQVEVGDGEFVQLSDLASKLKEVEEDQMVVLVHNQIIPCSSTSEAEEIIDLLVFKEGFSADDISIFQKKNIKLGIHVV